MRSKRPRSNLKSRNQDIQLHYAFEPFEAAILTACARKRQHPHVHAAPLKRFGYSGARLYELRFDVRGRGTPYVLKIDAKENLSADRQAVDDAMSFFPEARCDYVSPPRVKYAGMMHDLISPGRNITELRELYEAGGSKRERLSTERQACSLLRDVYTDRCAKAHAALTWRSITFGSHFHRYLRTQKDDRLPAVLPSGKATALYAATRPHPTTLLSKLGSVRRPAPLAFVHGDLHPNNVVIGDHGYPGLIDFAWAHDKGHILKDFVLMECSLRFLLFPSNLNWEDNHRVIELMVEEDGPARVAQLADRDQIRHAERYARMASLVAVLREAAREAVGAKYQFDEYLVAQFFVLYGLQKIPSYNAYACVDALREMGARLDSGS